MSEQTSHKKGKMKKRKLALRIFISVALILFFVYSVDLQETFEVILNTNYLLLLVCLIIYLLGQSISAYKWGVISKVIGFKNTYVEYLQYYYIGMFFNLFLPTTIGGDVGKAYYLSKGDPNGRKAPAIYTVLAERFSGLTVLVWLGTIALVSPVGHNVPLTIKIFAVCLSLAILIGAPLFPYFNKLAFSRKNWINRSMMKDVKVFWEYKLVLKCLGLSLLFHGLVILIHILIGLAIKLDVPLMYYFAVYPVVAIIGFIPIAFNGIGVREGAYIYFFKLAGVDISHSFAFGILWFAIVVIASLIGGIVYIKGHHAPPKMDDENEFTLKNIAEQEEIDSEDELKDDKINVSNNLISHKNQG
jgi:hypothetical protein